MSFGSLGFGKVMSSCAVSATSPGNHYLSSPSFRVRCPTPQIRQESHGRLLTSVRPHIIYFFGQNPGSQEPRWLESAFGCSETRMCHPSHHKLRKHAPAPVPTLERLPRSPTTSPLGILTHISLAPFPPPIFGYRALPPHRKPPHVTRPAEPTSHSPRNSAHTTP
jgi:hypothetical protein